MDAVAGEEFWMDTVQSRTSSLSMRGILRDEAKELAKVLLPVPGCPFIAIITGTPTCFSPPFTMFLIMSVSLDVSQSRDEEST